MASEAIWGIHAGRAGNADGLFLQRGYIAIGWAEMGNLSGLAGEREAFRALYVARYPHAKPGSIATSSGIPFRFIHEMKVGDLCAYPSKLDKHIHIGRVVGKYEYQPTGEASEYPHRRRVEWIRNVPRLQFSQGALYEIGSALSLFQIKNFADEFRGLASGKPPEQRVAVDDESIAAVAEDIEESTRDFILKRLSQDFKGLPLEDFVVHLLRCMGYHARLTRRNEPSVDVIAHKDHLGIEPPIIKIQVKSGADTVTDRDVSALYGKLSPGEYGLFICLSTYSSQCRSFEQSKSNLRLIDGDELVRLVLDHYESFDSEHKGLIPLRRVYVPQPMTTDAD